MRLINLHTLNLEEIWDQDAIKYAIPLHRREDGELSFQVMQNSAVACNTEGSAKIQNSCEHAVDDSHDSFTMCG